MAKGDVSVKTPDEKGSRSRSPGSDGLKNKGEEVKGGGTKGYLVSFSPLQSVQRAGRRDADSMSSAYSNMLRGSTGP